MRRYCRSPIPVPVHRPHLNRPAKSSRPGGSIEKCPTVGNVPSARDAANRRDFTFSTARWAMRPLPPPPRRTERHSTGTGCRETALPHGVTSEQRMLNPLRRPHSVQRNHERSRSALPPPCQRLTASLSRARARGVSRSLFGCAVDIPTSSGRSRGNPCAATTAGDGARAKRAKQSQRARIR